MYFSPFFIALSLLLSCNLAFHSGYALESESPLFQETSSWNSVLPRNLLSSSGSHGHAHHKDVRGSPSSYGLGEINLGQQQQTNRQIKMDVALGDEMKKVLFRSSSSGSTPPQEFSVAGMLKMTPLREPSCNETVAQMYATICKKEAAQQGSFRSKRASGMCFTF